MKTETEQPKKACSAPEAELRELGLTAAAEQVKTKTDMAHKLRIAFEHHQVVHPADFNAFNDRLLRETRKMVGYTTTYKQLVETPLEGYREVPPPDVLTKLREAKKLECFDAYTVASVEDQSHTRVPDPILFGKVTGSNLRFVIAQWDDDVRVEDIIGKEEGWSA